MSTLSAANERNSVDDRKKGTCKTTEKVLLLHEIRACTRQMQVQKHTMLRLWKKRPY